MSSVVAVEPPPTKTTVFRNPLLLAGGYFSLAFAVFQLSAIWWPPSALRYFGGPVQLSVQAPLVYAALCAVVAAIVAVFGLYALSGAGFVRRLPLLRTGLITIAVIYLLRGLLAIPQVPMVLRHPDLLRYLVCSLVALCVGLVHLFGVVSLYRHSRAGE